MALTNSQKVSLAAALRAEGDAGVVAALAIRNDVFLQSWCNGASATDAWKYAATRRDLFEAMDITQFDGLTGGKRDAWKVMMDNTPLDFSRAKNRKGVSDSWSTLTQAQQNTILTGLVEKATRAEVYLGASNNKTEGGVTALARDFVGNVGLTELSQVLNA